ncbi:hypothetical protein P1J78_24700 [Psychromarinibacter sp. C21-152]|uniref:Uncharacterized protein n=1 Tax=Psychromarinibacter sediminicola TaxID=3033385 RepID=A0AAE3P068_9RHOB|nr:hypothetical protein [Psychromarinibacter sediminicola]MDF0603917.1 hypothetical protein [Psychromarinibacter sediminicola]
MQDKHNIPAAVRDLQERRIRRKTGLPEQLAREVAAFAFGGACK